MTAWAWHCRCYDTLTVETLTTGELEFELSGEGAETLPRDASHLVVVPSPRPWNDWVSGTSGLRITADNVNPHGRGLGSSASAVVAAVTAANALVPEQSRPRDRDWILQLTSEMEGHPDNVAPAIFGGLALSWQDSDQYSSTCATVVGIRHSRSWPCLTMNCPPRLPAHCCRRPSATTPRP